MFLCFIPSWWEGLPPQHQPHTWVQVVTTVLPAPKKVLVQGKLRCFCPFQPITVKGVGNIGWVIWAEMGSVQQPAQTLTWLSGLSFHQ